MSFLKTCLQNGDAVNQPSKLPQQNKSVLRFNDCQVECGKSFVTLAPKHTSLCAGRFIKYYASVIFLCLLSFDS